MSNDFGPGWQPDPAAYGGFPAAGRRSSSPDLLERWTPLAEEAQRRSADGALPLPLINSARPGRWFLGHDANGQARQGINFCSTDHLNLGSHPDVVGAATTALAEFGPHSAGKPGQAGQSTAVAALEAGIAAFAGYADSILFPSGWTAGFALMRTLLHRGDHVVSAAGLPGGLAEGIGASGARIHRLPRLSADLAAQRIGDLRGNEPRAGILLVVESLSATDSRFADLAALQDLCLRHRATLVVDVTADFGAIGRSGRGALDLQFMVGCVDIIVGGLSRVFAANGGFVASNHLALRPALRHGPMAETGGAAPSPTQIAAATQALDIIATAEGNRRRSRLMANIRRLRGCLVLAGLDPAGQPGPTVTVSAGSPAMARRATVALHAAGILACLIDTPIRRNDTALWQFQVMADHQPGDIDTVRSVLQRLLAAGLIPDPVAGVAINRSVTPSKPASGSGSARTG